MFGYSVPFGVPACKSTKLAGDLTFESGNHPYQTSIDGACAQTSFQTRDRNDEIGQHWLRLAQAEDDFDVVTASNGTAGEKTIIVSQGRWRTLPTAFANESSLLQEHNWNCFWCDLQILLFKNARTAPALAFPVSAVNK